MTQIYRMDCKEESGLHIQAGKQFPHEILKKAMQILQFSFKLTVPKTINLASLFSTFSGPGFLNMYRT
jgi:hypothetical protein